MIDYCVIPNIKSNGMFSKILELAKKENYQWQQLIDYIFITTGAISAFCAFEDEQLVGYAIFTCDENNDILFLEELFVATNKRHMGIGSQLFELCESVADENNAKFQLLVKDSNALRYYLKRNMKVIGKRYDHFLLEKTT